MATSLSVPQVAAQIQANERSLWRLWQGLPTDPLTERELEDAISAAANRPGDRAFAKAIVANLCMATPVHVDGELTNQYAVTLRKDDRGSWVYERSETYPVSTATLAQAMDLELEKAQARERQRFEEIDAESQRRLETGPWGIERRDTINLIRDVVKADGAELLREAIREELRVLLAEASQTELDGLRERLRAVRKEDTAAA